MTLRRTRRCVGRRHQFDRNRVRLAGRLRKSGGADQLVVVAQAAGVDRAEPQVLLQAPPAPGGRDRAMHRRAADGDAAGVKDANGQLLADGDSVVLIKDLKVKGTSVTLKMGTKVKSIRRV